MKKYSIVILCLILVNTCFSQLTLIPEIGYNQSVFYTNAPSTQVVTSSINGFQAGVLVNRTLGKYFFLQTGLEYAQKGSYQGRGSQALYGSDVTDKLTYLQAPLNLGVNYSVTKDLSVFASGGVYLALGLSGTRKGSTQNINGTTTADDTKVDFTNDNSGNTNGVTYIKPVDLGYDFSGGVSFKNVLVKTVFSQGFKSASPVGATLYKNQVLNFSLGYTIHLN